MPYILINPVTASMYDMRLLSEFLAGRGFTPVSCRTDWIRLVREKYADAAACAAKPLVDMRCPEAVAFVRGSFPGAPVLYPDIEPILLHCAREIAARFGDKDAVTVTTPCRALADYGNAIGLKNTQFVAWSTFARQTGCRLPSVHLAQSPIPPGFFSRTGDRVRSVSGKACIGRFFAEGRYEGARIVEMLFCPDGCNNGDGVL